MPKLTLGSLFDGSGGFPLGGLLCGIMPIWASEVEPFPLRVTTKRLPQMRHLGDISAINGGEIEPVDIITFGSPCQDMSVAGKRTGLDGERSNLFYEAVRIIKEMRCKTGGTHPRTIVWENVPGAFSSNKREDFRCVLEAIAKVKDETVSIPKPAKWTNAGNVVGDGFSIAWRVLDAQYWGVPQRRRRIFLVADFAGECADQILFECESVPGDSSPRSGSGQGTARSAEACTGATILCLNDQGGNRMDVTEGVTTTLRAESHHPPLVFDNHGQCCRYRGPLPIAPTISATYGTGGNNQPFVTTAGFCPEHSSKSHGIGYEEETSPTLRGAIPAVLTLTDTPKTYGICSKDSNSMKSANPNSGIYTAETSRTLDGNGGNPSCNQGWIAVVSVQGSMIGRKPENGPQGSGVGEGVSFTLDATDRHAVAYGIDRAAFNQGQNALYGFAVEEELESTLVAKGPSAVAHPTYRASKASFFTAAEKELAHTLVATDYKDPPLVGDAEIQYTVRRITPTECARLQGFPDFWCDALGTTDPTEEEIAWWADVFETHRKMVGKSKKPKSRNQIIKWLKSPHSDSAEYKMWGNGVALPCVVFVLHGIAERYRS